MPAYFGKDVSKPISRLARSGALDTGDVAAALAIEAAVVSILTNDLHAGYRDGVHPGNPGQGFAEGRLLRFHDQRALYYDWVDAMTAAGLSAGPVLDVIIEGKPLTAIDLAWKKRKGWARRLVQQGLALYRSMALARKTATERLTA